MKSHRVRRRRGPALRVRADVRRCGSRGAGPVGAQLPSTEERLKILTDPESVKQKVEKDKARPPLEFFRSQVAPFDVLPFVKPNHWSTLALEMRANYENYVGLLQTSPVRLMGMPREGAGMEAPQESGSIAATRGCSRGSRRASVCRSCSPRFPKSCQWS